MFQKLVAAEPCGLDTAAQKQLDSFAKEVILYQDSPRDQAELIERIGDADALLISFTTPVSREAVAACPHLRYIGMCCSLYDEKSANVDIAAARECGVTVTGIRDYGDEGVIEFGISELVRLLHGFGEHQWRERPLELTGQKAGIVGLGKTGLMFARALRFFGADVSYYSRTRRPELEEREGYRYLPFTELLETVDILSTHLNKNTILLHEAEFERFGAGKILLNTAIGPSFSLPAIQKWLACPQNYYICDSVAMGSYYEQLRVFPNVICPMKSSGASVQSTQRLCKKVLENIAGFLEK